MGDHERAAQEKDRRAKVLAIQIVAQLPADTDEALSVLELARKLVDEFMRPPRLERSGEKKLLLVKTHEQ